MDMNLLVDANPVTNVDYLAVNRSVYNPHLHPVTQSRTSIGFFDALLQQVEFKRPLHRFQTPPLDP